MAIARSDSQNTNGTTDFFADSVADVANLPTNIDVGSTCLVINTAEIYILAPAGSWVKL